MADIYGAGITTDYALTANNAKTLVQLLAANNHKVRVTGWGVFFDGNNATATPVTVRLLRQSSAGTMSALTLVKTSSDSETLQTTGQSNATAEPTAGDVLDSAKCHPQGGFEKLYPLGQEVKVPGAGRIGLECNSTGAVNVRATIYFEE